jgi:hypothetical protein
LTAENPEMKVVFSESWLGIVPSVRRVSYRKETTLAPFLC